MDKPQQNCPICRKPAQKIYFPFCSQKCADIDLNRWLGGNYRIPSESTNEEEIDELCNSLKETLDQT